MPMETGKISFYDREEPYFEAKCMHHNKCTLRRTSRASERPRRQAQGRPLGTMLEWLAAGHTAATKDDHMNPLWLSSLPRHIRHEQRVRMRRDGLFRALEVMERPKREGETSEPEDVP